MIRTAPRAIYLLGAFTLFGLTGQTSIATAQAVTGYGGDAYAIRTDEGGSASLFGDTGSLPASGGSLTGNLGSFTDFYLATSLTSGNASTSGGGGIANTSAEVFGLNFKFRNIDHIITADSVQITTQATAGGVTATALFTNLTVNDGSNTYVNYTGTIAANTILDLSAAMGRPATLTLNRQIDSSTPGHNEITAEALDIFSSGTLEVNLAHANSDVSFAPIPEPAHYQMAVLLTLGGIGMWRRRRPQRNL